MISYETKVSVSGAHPAESIIWLMSTMRLYMVSVWDTVSLQPLPSVSTIETVYTPLLPKVWLVDVPVGEPPSLNSHWTVPGGAVAVNTSVAGAGHGSVGLHVKEETGCGYMVMGCVTVS